MLKFLLIVLFISCKPCEGADFEFFDLRYFGDTIRNVSLEMFYFTQSQNEGNIAMAPYAMWNLICLVAFKTYSDTWRQLHSLLGISKRDGQYFNSIFKFEIDGMMNSLHLPGATYRTKQIVFYDENLELSQSFQRGIVNSGALLKKLDFEDRYAAAESANGDIQLYNNSFAPKQIVFDHTDFEESSMIVSGNIEFLGNWSLPFDESKTILEEDNGVYMMYRKGQIKHLDIEILGASAIELDYGESEEYSMVIVRPHQNVTINDVLINFGKISFLDVITKLYSEQLKEGDVKLPKFSITSSLILNGPLRSMKIRDAFLSSLADFSGITAEEIFISAIEQRTVIAVSETGTVATAFTPGNLAEVTKTSTTKTAEPFLFFIVYRPTMGVIFCGKYGE